MSGTSLDSSPRALSLERHVPDQSFLKILTSLKNGIIFYVYPIQVQLVTLINTKEDGRL